MSLVLSRWCWLVSLGLIALPSLEAQEPASMHALLRAFGIQGWRALELVQQREREHWLQDQPVYHGLWLREPDAQDSSVFDFLPFASAPRRRAGAALAYDQGTGARMWSGFTEADPTRSALLGAAAHALLGLWRLLPPVDGGPRDLLGARQCPGMRLRLGAEAAFGFGTDGRDAAPDTRTLLVYAECRRELGGAWQVSAGLRGYQWRTPAGPDRQDLESSLRLAHVPPQDALRVFLDASWTPRYQRAVLHLERPLDAAGLRIRPLLRVAWGEGLPYALGFWPGGFDGFPGLQRGEGRGDREVMAALDLRRPLAGKLALRALLATGRTALGGPLIGGGPWLVGVRAGLNLDTKIGLVRLEYGRATRGHHALFLRVGNIF